MPDPVTTADHDQLQRLRQVDALVHVHVMDYEPDWQDYAGSKPAPRYTTSWDAAGRVVERMRQLGWDLSLSETAAMRHEPWDCRWFFGDNGRNRAIAHAATAPLAIARAALQALGIEAEAARGNPSDSADGPDDMPAQGPVSAS